ncbi:GM22571 [Drosophila sechellia]|uniref:GM22571 n=1 Tax=Drosophila sechellia TaxID=7238 RepID=B4IKB6_DROSE|nr:GM22571 [Drosophila sechellia]
MNALRNIFTSRTLNYLRQNGQNAILNATQQQPAVDAVPLTNDAEQQLKSSRPAPLSIPRSILDACHFTAKQFDLGRTTSGNQGE